MNPLVTIIIPTYNREFLISETLQSLTRQTYKNWECIIVDDNSNDNSEIVIKKIIQEDDRFLYIVKPNKSKTGASSSRNLGLSNAKGDYIQFLDSDDVLANNKLEEQIKLLSNQGEYSIATCKWGFFETTDKPFEIFENNADFRNFESPKDYFDIIGQNGGFFPCHCYLFKKELLDLSGYWNENLTMNDDGEFFFRIVLNASSIIFSPETYVLYRKQDNINTNLSALNSKEKANDLVSSWKSIEKLYLKKYNEIDSLYLNKKKANIYNELINKYPRIIRQNKIFFRKQIKEDTLVLKLKKIKKKIIMKLKIILKKY